MLHQQLSPEEEAIGTAIVNAAFKVHTAIGPGLLQKIYVTCMVHELRKSGHFTERHVALPVHYDGLIFREGLKMDILVQQLVVAQVKAVDNLNPYYHAELLSHLKLTKRRLGFLINFNVALIKDGIRRIIN